jgi:hypothetical protein
MSIPLFPGDSQGFLVTRISQSRLDLATRGKSIYARRLAGSPIKTVKAYELPQSVELEVGVRYLEVDLPEGASILGICSNVAVSGGFGVSVERRFYFMVESATGIARTEIQKFLVVRADASRKIPASLRCVGFLDQGTLSEKEVVYAIPTRLSDSHNWAG